MMRSTATDNNATHSPLHALRAELDARVDAAPVTTDWVLAVQRRRRDLVSFRRRQRWMGAAVGVAACFGVGLGFAIQTKSTSVAMTAAVPSSLTLVSGASLALADGTLVQAQAGGDVQVDDLSINGATVRVRSGGVHARITHRDAQTQWSFHAGAFTVKVIGTEFDLVWNQVAAKLHVQMAHGTVRVFGPCLVADGVPVANEASADFGDECKKDAPSAGQLAMQPAVPTVDQVAPPVKPLAPSNTLAVGAPVPSPTPTHLNETLSFEATLEQAHTARLRGDFIGAKRLYAFVEHASEATMSQRAIAVFEQGRLGSKQGNHAEALAAYQRLLAMGETTPLYEEGLARAAEESLAVGHSVEAQDLARTYLRAFPEGSYASQARRILSP